MDLNGDSGSLDQRTYVDQVFRMFSISRRHGDYKFFAIYWSANVEPFPALGRTFSLTAANRGSFQGIPRDIGNRGFRP